MAIGVRRRWTVAVTGSRIKRGSRNVAATMYAETPESSDAGTHAWSASLPAPSGADLGPARQQARRRLDAMRRGRRRER